jgi:poly(hydroxyalkanoate) granule-associated protein
VVSGLIRGTRAAWWAGLGLLDVAQSAGAQVFDALVEEGKSWEQAQRERREQRARQVRRATRESDAIQAAEERVQEEVNAALQRIGVPSRDDVDALKDQIEALNDRVDRLTDAVRHTDA